MERRVNTCLTVVRDWAHMKVARGQEPPWAWYQYMKLMEAVDAIRDGRSHVRPMEEDSRRQKPRQPETTRPQEGEVVELDTPRRRRRRKGPPPLPM